MVNNANDNIFVQIPHSISILKRMRQNNWITEVYNMLGWITMFFGNLKSSTLLLNNLNHYTKHDPLNAD